MSLYQSCYLQPQVFGWKAHLSIYSFIQHISWVPAICQALFWKLRKNKWTLFLTHGNSMLWGNSKVMYFKSPPVLIPVCNVLSGGQPASAEVVSFSCHVIFFLSADRLASYPHWETHGPLGLRLQVPASPNISVYAHPSLLSSGYQEVTVFPLSWLSFHLCPSPVALTTPPLLDLHHSPQFVKKAEASHFNRLHLTLQPFLTSATSGPSKARFLKG